MNIRGIFLTTIVIASSLTAQASLSSKISTYENSSKVNQTLNYMKRNVLSGSRGLCAKYVRLGFMNSGLIPSHPGISYAKNYTPYFNKNGWTNLVSKSEYKEKLKDDLFNAPSGCAVVYDAINPKNDRNGYIGHIETRIKNGKPWGFISDYYHGNPRTGLKCAKPGKTVKRLKVFTARDSSPYHKGGQRVKVYIDVTSCAQHTSKGAFTGDEFKNRKVIGVHCKL